MRNTPKETPVVARPETAVAPDSSRQAEGDAHAATVTTPHGSTELPLGSHVIGRLGRCEIPLDDPLASRVHAVIRIDERGAVLEDLHSTNGVYVNDRRVVRSTPLNHGDRILVGTTELSFFKPARKAQGARVEPAPAPHVAPVLGRLGGYEGSPTERRSALSLVAALAQRLAAGGSVVEAERTLSTHLLRIAQGAQAGLVVTDEVLEFASEQALTLAGWTGRARWTDYVIELHLMAKRVMSRRTVDSFTQARARLPEHADAQLLDYYVQSIKARVEPLTDAERISLFELEAIADR